MIFFSHNIPTFLAVSMLLLPIQFIAKILVACGNLCYFEPERSSLSYVPFLELFFQLKSNFSDSKFLGNLEFCSRRVIRATDSHHENMLI